MCQRFLKTFPLNFNILNNYVKNLFELAKALKELGKSTESESIVNFILTYAPDTQVAIETRKIDWRA
jgi:hypothetical protein